MAQIDAFALIRTVIRSVWALELLLLMRRQSERGWTVDELVQELRASAPLVRQSLIQLSDGGLVRLDGDDARYDPVSPGLEDACAYLDQAFRERPVSIVNLIVSGGVDTIQGFADAFKFKRGDD